MPVTMQPGTPGVFIPLGWEDQATFLAVWGHVPIEEARSEIQKQDDWIYSEPEHYGDPVLGWGCWEPSKHQDPDGSFKVYSEQFLGAFPVTVLWLVGDEWSYGKRPKISNGVA